MLRYAIAALTLALVAGAPLSPVQSYTVPSGPLEPSECEQPAAQPSPGAKKIFDIDSAPSGRAVPKIVIRTTASDGSDDSTPACRKASSSGKDQPAHPPTSDAKR